MLQLRVYSVSSEDGEEVNIQPIKDRIWLRRVEHKQKGLIIVPESAQEPNVLCEVLAVGPGKWVTCKNAVVRQPMTVAVGDLVYIGKFVDMDVDGGTVICSEDDVRGIEDCNRVLETVEINENPTLAPSGNQIAPPQRMPKRKRA